MLEHSHDKGLSTLYTRYNGVLLMITPMVLGFRTASYALGIYIYGTYRLTARDGFNGVATGYYTPTEQYAANNFPKDIIDNALAMTYISQQEYNETIALIPAI
jgi:hypothetical protein